MSSRLEVGPISWSEESVPALPEAQGTGFSYVLIQKAAKMDIVLNPFCLALFNIFPFLPSLLLAGK